MDRIIGFFKKYYYLLTGLLIFLSFPTYDIWLLKGFAFFAWISLVPLLIHIRENSYKEILFSSFVSGLIGSYLVYGWLGDFGANMEGGYYILVALIIPNLTFFFVTKIIISEFFSRKYEKCRLIIYPSVWILIDWIQSIGFLAFPWTYWGYSQYKFTPFMQISAYTGIMGITFILIFANVTISNYLFNYFKHGRQLRPSLKSAEFKILISFLLILLLIIIYGLYVIIKNDIPEKRDLRVAVIQSCISPWENWRENRFIYLQHLEYYTNLSLQHDPDMIIWSESATLENISFHYKNGNLNLFERKVLDIARTSGKPLLTGEIGVIEDIINDKYFPQNNAVLIDGNGSVADTYAKINLAPVGEWFPYLKWLPFFKGILDKGGASNFVPGSDPLLFKALNRRFGTLICYEGVFYRLCRTYKNMGSDFLVNITNLGWTKKYAGHLQQFAASRFRAVENGIWFISATNTGYTALIDPYGKITGSIPRLDKGYLVSDLNFDKNHITFYSEYGDILLYLAAAFIFGICIVSLYKFIMQSNNKKLSG